MRKTSVILWVVAAILAGLLLGVKGMMVWRVRTIMQADNAREAAIDRLYDDLLLLHGKTKQQVEDELRSRGWPVLQYQPRPGQTIMWFTDANKATYTFRYYGNDRFYLSVNTPPRSRFPFVAHYYRGLLWLTGLTGIAWALVAALALEGLFRGSLRKWRRLAAQGMIAIAGLSLLTWAIEPDVVSMFRDSWRQDVPWIRLAMLGLGGIALVWPARKITAEMLHPHCQRCGYDLTGNESGICPECGRPVPWAGRAEAAASLQDMLDAPVQEPAEPAMAAELPAEPASIADDAQG